MALDFEQEFSKFVNTSNGSAIHDIYKIIPTMNQQQMKVLHALRFYIEKYELNDLDKFINSYCSNLDNNKNLNFLSSMNMKALLKAYTQDELIRGIKISTNSKEE